MKLQTISLSLLLIVLATLLGFEDLTAQRPSLDNERFIQNNFLDKPIEFLIYDGVRPGDKGDQQTTTALSVTGGYTFHSANNAVHTYVIYFTVNDIFGNTEVSLTNLSPQDVDFAQTNFSLSASDEGQQFSTEVDIPIEGLYQPIHIQIDATSLVQPGGYSIVTIDGLRSDIFDTN